MQAFFVSAFAFIAMGAAFLAEAVAAFPVNDWQRVSGDAQRCP